LRKQLHKEYSNRVCHISTVHPLNDNRVFHKECKSLAKAGFDLTLIITHTRNETIDGVKIVGLKKRKRRLSRMLFGTFEALRYAIKERACIYHFHDPELIPTGIALKILGKKVIYDVHENTSQQMLNKEYIGGMFKRQIASMAVGFAERISKVVFDVIVAARPDIAEHWNSKKVRLVINAAAIETIDNIDEVSIDKPKPVIIYAGGLTRIRGIKQLIKAMELVESRAELWLLGKWGNDAFRQECEGLEGWKYTRYMGYMAVDDVFAHMKKSDIGVVPFLPVPNHLTTLPNKPFEYMSCRLPVIMSNFLYWREVFGEKVLFADPESPREIAKQINRLLNDPQLRSTFGENGRKLVEDKYSWETEVTKLIETYNQLSSN